MSKFELKLSFCLIQMSIRCVLLDRSKNGNAVSKLQLLCPYSKKLLLLLGKMLNYVLYIWINEFVKNSEGCIRMWICDV